MPFAFQAEPCHSAPHRAVTGPKTDPIELPCSVERDSFHVREGLEPDIVTVHSNPNQSVILFLLKFICSLGFLHPPSDGHLPRGLPADPSMRHQFTSSCWSEIGWRSKQTKESPESIYSSFVVYWRRHTTVWGHTSLLSGVIFRSYWMFCLIHRIKQPRELEPVRERTDIQIISWSLLKLRLSFMRMKAMITGLRAPLLLLLLLLTSWTSLCPVCIFSLSWKTICVFTLLHMSLPRAWVRDC